MTRNEDYRQQVRQTMQAFSDEALAYQDRIIIGGIDREECDREIERRMLNGTDMEMVEPKSGWARKRYASNRSPFGGRYRS